MTNHAILVSILVLASLLTQPARAADPAYGLWLTQNQRAIVEIAPCAGEHACGRLIWSAAPRDESGALKRDHRNEDPTLRSRTLCGMPLIGGFTHTAEGKWRNGWIYNPRDGDTYSAQLEALDAKRLKVRGYLGIALFGKSQIWTRVDDDRGGCL